MSQFRERIYALSQQIPKGQVATYGQLARLAGRPGAARAVGVCMRLNQDTKRVPCHRVVASDGALTGYAFGGTGAKKAKLQAEGVKFVGDRVDLARSQWRR